MKIPPLPFTVTGAHRIGRRCARVRNSLSSI